MNKNYYKVLGISPDANKSEIKKAYFAKAKMYHPDVCKDKDAEEKFKEISTAYETLSDDDSKKRYDEHVKNGSNNQTDNYKNNSESSDTDYSVLHELFVFQSHNDVDFFDVLKSNYKTEQEVASAYAYFWLSFWSGGKGTIDMLKNKTASKIFKAFCSNPFIKEMKESLNKEVENNSKQRDRIYDMKMSLKKIYESIPEHKTSSQASFNWMIKLINDENIFDDASSMYDFLLISSDVFNVLTKFEEIFDGAADVRAKSHYSNNTKIKRGGGIFSSILTVVFIALIFRWLFW